MKVRKFMTIVVLSIICNGCGFKGPLTLEDNSSIHKDRKAPSKKGRAMLNDSLDQNASMPERSRLTPETSGFNVLYP